jgi:hypothetical protein
VPAARVVTAALDLGKATERPSEIYDNASKRVNEETPQRQLFVELCAAFVAFALTPLWVPNAR